MGEAYKGLGGRCKGRAGHAAGVQAGAGGSRQSALHGRRAHGALERAGGRRGERQARGARDRNAGL